MTIADLKKYREYSEKYDCIVEQLESKYVKDSVFGDSGEPAHEKVSRSVEGYIHGVGTISLLAAQSKYKAQMEEIENFIQAIPRKTYRKALTLYCLDTDHSYKWAQISEMLDYEGDLRRNIANYLDRISYCE